MCYKNSNNHDRYKLKKYIKEIYLLYKKLTENKFLNYFQYFKKFSISFIPLRTYRDIKNKVNRCYYIDNNNKNK